MRAVLSLLAVMASHVLAQNPIKAKSYTGWDCCKPICASNNGRQDLLNNRGVVRVCNKNNQQQDRDTGLRANSGCASGAANNAYMCDTYQPAPISNEVTYGYAIQVSDSQNADNPNCCKCHEVTWLSGGAVGKKMIVQIVTPGGSGGDVKRNDLIILTPGGGVGPLSTGCTNQYGNSFAWGEQRGGVKNREACEKLPTNLQGGCYWRFNWARGEINGWDIEYRPVECPARLIEVSGCRA